MKLTEATSMRPMLLLIVLAGHVAQLTQSIRQLALKPREEEIRKRAGGSSGAEDGKLISE